MDDRLLVDLEAIVLLDSLSARIRTRLLAHLRKLRSGPERFSAHHEYDRVGRRIEISVIVGYSIHYWIDPADRHIKILAIKPADR